MEEFYFAGVFAAFVIGVIKVALTSANLLSLRTQNMNRIGLHYACLAGNYTPAKSSPWSIFWFAVYMLLLTPIASWLSVASAAWSWVRWRASQTAVPEDMKRLQYRLAHVTMTKEQMIAWQEEVSKVLGIIGPVRTGDSDDDPLVFVLEKGDWPRELRMQPDKHTFEFYSHAADYSGIFRSTYEYRFNGDVLLAKLLDKHSKHYNEKYWYVRDGVVLEEDIRRGSLASPGEIDKRLANYHDEVAWHPVRDARVRFFAMTMHPAQFPHSKISELVRAEIQRAGAAAEKALLEARKLSFQIVETDDGFEFRFAKGQTEQEKATAGHALSEVIDELGSSDGEIRHLKKDKTQLMEVLGQKV